MKIKGRHDQPTFYLFIPEDFSTNFIDASEWNTKTDKLPLFMESCPVNPKNRINYHIYLEVCPINPILNVIGLVIWIVFSFSLMISFDKPAPILYSYRC
jgi:hypothetical protein